MPGKARKKLIDPDKVGVYHCYARCVRRAFLCGDDPYTGKNYDHRKKWVRDKQLVKTMRERLSSLSWFMKRLCEWIAKEANREDGVTGHFSRGASARGRYSMSSAC